MQVIQIDGPKLDVQTKRKIVEDMTSYFSRVNGIDPQWFVALIRENPAENVGSGGELVADSPARTRREGND